MTKCTAAVSLMLNLLVASDSGGLDKGDAGRLKAGTTEGSGVRVDGRGGVSNDKDGHAGLEEEEGGAGQVEFSRAATEVGDRDGAVVAEEGEEPIEGGVRDGDRFRGEVQRRMGVADDDVLETIRKPPHQQLYCPYCCPPPLQPRTPLVQIQHHQRCH